MTNKPNNPLSPEPDRAHPVPRQIAPYGTTYPYPYGSHYGIPGNASPLIDFSPRRMVRTLIKKWYVPMLVLLFTCSAAVFYLWKTPKVYRSTSLIELSVRRPRILTQQAAVIEENVGASQTEEIFNTRLEIFKGRSIMQAALERLLGSHPDAFASPQEVSGDRAVDAEVLKTRQLRLYRDGIQLTLLRRTRLIQVTFAHTNPLLAAAACNAFADSAEASAYDDNRIGSDAAVTWLETQAELQREELRKADDELLKFMSDYSIDALESRRRTVEDALLSFNKSLVDIESREAGERQLLATLDQIDLQPEQAGELPSGIPRAEEIRKSLDMWRTATAERDGLLSRYTIRHPEVLVKDRLIELNRRQALDMLEQAKTTTKANCELMAKQAESLRQKVVEQAKAATELDLQIAKGKTLLASLERAHAAADQSYRGILTRIQDARMAADENTATVKRVEMASIPVVPFKPRPVRILALAIILGLVGGTALALATEALEDHIYGPEDVAAWGHPVLAVVPHAKAGDRYSTATASLQGSFNPVAEAFAGLRAMLDSPQHKDHAKVVMVASSAPGEGKTVTGCNLAVAWAKKGQKVLLVDFDLRRPRLAGIFPMPPEKLGLLETLTRGADGTGADLAYPVEICPGLDVIASRPSGRTNPAEAVGTAAAEGLITWARAHYDHIVIDAPPLGLVSDALALAPLADSILLMARTGVSRKRMTQHTLGRFKETGMHNIGVVVNDVDFSKLNYGAYGAYAHYQKHYSAYASGAEGA